MRLVFPAAFAFLPYLPLGLLILIVRLFIYPHAIIASLVLASFGFVRRSVLRVMCCVLGFVVRTTQRKNLSDIQKCLPIVSNHVTLFDHLMICLTRDCVTPHPHVFHWNSTYTPLRDESVSELVGRAVQKGLCSVQLFPEKRPSDITDRLLKFDANLLECIDKIQPVALRVTRPFPVKVVEYPIHWFAELLWHLFVPFTVYHIEYLEPMARLPNETSADFATRIQKAISRALYCESSTLDENHDNKVNKPSSLSREPTLASSNTSSSTASPVSSVSTVHSSAMSFSSAALEEYDGLRYRGPSSASDSPVEYTTPGPSPSLVNDRLLELENKMFDHLISSVQEVLADAPTSNIRNALIRADGDVDAAIDALVSTHDDCSYSESKHSATLPPVGRLRMAADTFHTSSKARQTSLQERRAAMLAHARERFASNDTSD